MPSNILLFRRSAVGAVVSTVAVLTSGVAARAQFSSFSLPTLTEASGSTGAAISGSAGKYSHFSLGFYPITPFQFDLKVKELPVNYVVTNNSTGAVISSTASTVQAQNASFTANGVLFAPEYVYTLKNQTSGVGVGGWYWLHTQSKSESYSDKFDANLYDIHAKYFATPKLGLELGYLGQSNDSIPKQEGVNAYVSYAFGTSSAAKKGSFSGTAGLGIQSIDKTTQHVLVPNSVGTVDETFAFKQTTDLGAYINGAYHVMPHGSINLSYWLLTGKQNIDVSASESAGGASAAAAGSTSQNRTTSRYGLGYTYEF